MADKKLIKRSANIIVTWKAQTLLDSICIDLVDQYLWSAKLACKVNKLQVIYGNINQILNHPS